MKKKPRRSVGKKGVSMVRDRPGEGVKNGGLGERGGATSYTLSE